jgi:hypothetical protein
MNVRRLGILMVVTFAAPVRAQEAHTLDVGQRAQVVVREVQRQDGTPLRREIVLRGDVTRFSGDTLFLRPAGTIGELGIPIMSALRLYRSGGVRSRAVSMIRNTFVGGLLGALYLGTMYYGARENASENLATHYLQGAAVGAATGLVLGALLPTERWHRLR